MHASGVRKNCLKHVFVGASQVDPTCGSRVSCSLARVLSLHCNAYSRRACLLSGASQLCWGAGPSQSCSYFHAAFNECNDRRAFSLTRADPVIMYNHHALTRQRP